MLNFGLRLGKGKQAEPVVPSLPYDPIELHPDWYLLEGHSKSKIDADGLIIKTGGSTTDSAVCFTQAAGVDGWVEAVVEYQSGGTAEASFMMAMRITNGQTFVGVRNYTNKTQLYARLNGAFTMLGEYSQVPIGTKLRIECNSNEVQLFINGVGQGITTNTTVLTMGRIGFIARGWTSYSKGVVSALKFSMPIIGYRPLEDHPDWYKLGGSPLTSTAIVGEMVSFSGSTALDTPVAYDTTEWLNGTIVADLLYANTAGATGTFIMGTRMVDTENYIGVRTLSGNIEVIEKVASAFGTPTVTVPNPAIGTRIRLDSILNELILYFDDVEVGRGFTTLNVAGRQGLIARAWGAGAQDVIDHFSASEGPSEEVSNWDFELGDTDWNSIVVTDGIANTVGGTGNQVITGLEVGATYRMAIRADVQGVLPAASIHDGVGVGSQIIEMTLNQTAGFQTTSATFVTLTDTITLELKNGSNTALWDWTSIRKIV